MSNLKERQRQKSRELAARREPLTLPATGETWQVRGLMLGDRERVGELSGFKRTATILALGLEDPATGQQVYNPNDLDDHNALAEWHGDDAEAAVNAIVRLSGMDADAQKRAEGKSPEGETGSSSGSSAPALVALPANSDAA